MRSFNRTILLKNENGDRRNFVMPGETWETEIIIPGQEFPVTHALRIIGETDVFWKWREESGSPYHISMSIEDVLTTKDTPREKFAMRIKGNNELYPRNAYLKLKQNTFAAGQEYRFEIFGKAENLTIAPGGEALVELGIYRRRENRHPDDTYDMPDEIQQLRLDPGSYNWKKLELQFTMPEDAVCLLLRIGVNKVSGVAMFGSARLYVSGGDNLVPPLDHSQPRRPEYNYLGENLSRRDWPEFTIAVDGKKVFQDAKYTSIYRRPDFEIPIGDLSPGKHTLSIRLDADYDSAVGFVFQQLELMEYGNHDFELLAFPEYLGSSESCHILLKTNVDNVKIHIASQEYDFPQSGYNVLTLPPIAPCVNHTIKLQSATHEDFFVIKQVVEGASDNIFLSSGDAVFINQNPTDFNRYFEWYMQNHVGNSMCFRPAYRWSGSRIVNTAAWQTITPMLEKMNMSYTLMVDGRELPGRNANPPDDLIAGPCYRGRQAHENDGAFYYWNNILWRPEPLPEPYADLLARGIDKGGIQPHVRPKRRGNRAWWFFDPTTAKNMKEAADEFVRNLAEAKYDSIRHTGPSVLFRYFFQAGYNFLGAEQMYGPEEVILAALRGASTAYGKTGFGAHLATQWSSTPLNTPEHAERYWLSMATCYLQGVTEINIEEGLWRMERGHVDYDRFSENCLRHLEAHTRFRRFLQSHRRRGNIHVPLAVIQGRYDGWCCFSRNNVWSREGEQWQFGKAEESFDLLNVFYPRSKFEGISRCPCPIAPQGWYSGTPYGVVDLTPFEADWSRYRTVIFLGWHTFEPTDANKMLDFVRNGGTLVLTAKHLSPSLVHNDESEHPADNVLNELLGKNWKASLKIIRRSIGVGKIIFFPNNEYPAAESIRSLYENEMSFLGEAITQEERDKGWIRANHDVNFSVFDRDDGSRVIYLLNVRWWDKADSEVSLLLGRFEQKITVSEGAVHIITVYGEYAVMCNNADADVISFDGKTVRIQAGEAGSFDLFGKQNKRFLFEAGVTTISI